MEGNETTLEDMQKRIAEMVVREEELLTQKKQLEEDFGLRRAKLKDLYMQKEEELRVRSLESSVVVGEVEELRAELRRSQTELEEARSAVTIAQYTAENDIAVEKRKCQEEMATLQQFMKEEATRDVDETGSRYEVEMKKIKKNYERVEAEKQRYRLLYEQKLEESESRGRSDSLLSPGVLSAVTKTLAKKVPSLSPAHSSVVSDRNSSIVAGWVNTDGGSTTSSSSSSAVVPTTTTTTLTTSTIAGNAGLVDSQESLEESMKRAQEDAAVLRSLVLPLEEEIGALKDKIRDQDVQLRANEAQTQANIRTSDVLAPLMQGKNATELVQELDIKLKGVSSTLEAEKSSRADLELYTAILNTQKIALTDDLDRVRSHTNELRQLYDTERRDHSELRNTWQRANDQFLDSQRLYLSDLRMIHQLLTPDQLKLLQEMQRTSDDATLHNAELLSVAQVKLPMESQGQSHGTGGQIQAQAQGQSHGTGGQIQAQVQGQSHGTGAQIQTQAQGQSHGAGGQNQAQGQNMLSSVTEKRKDSPQPRSPPLHTPRKISVGSADIEDVTNSESEDIITELMNITKEEEEKDKQTENNKQRDNDKEDNIDKNVVEEVEEEEEEEEEELKSESSNNNSSSLCDDLQCDSTDPSQTSETFMAARFTPDKMPQLSEDQRRALSDTLAPSDGVECSPRMFGNKLNPSLPTIENIGCRQRVVSEREWSNLQLEIRRTHVNMNQACTMCASLQSRISKLETDNRDGDRLRTQQEKALQRQREDLHREAKHRKLVELKWKQTAQQYERMEHEVSVSVECASKRHTEVVNCWMTAAKKLQEQLSHLAERREQLQMELTRLQAENDALVGKHGQHSQEMQNEVISLPDTMEDMQLLLLRYREDIIAAKVGKEHCEESLNSKILFLKDQVLAEQHERTTMEERLSNQIDQLRSKVVVFDRIQQEMEVERSNRVHMDQRLLETEQKHQESHGRTQQIITGLKTHVIEQTQTKTRLEAEVLQLKGRVGTLQHDLDTSEAVQRDFVRLSQSLQVQLEKIRQSDKEVRWQHEEDTEECNSCHQRFTAVGRRKHHCRHCGKVFCADCVTKLVPSGPQSRPSKVCDVCHTLLVQDATPYFSTDPPQSPD